MSFFICNIFMDQFLTEKEFEIVVDSDFLLTKARIIQKVVGKFEELRVKMIERVASTNFEAPATLDVEKGKVFRGENYKNLPYVVLDYPKCFSTQSVFAIRTMFWWGNFLSITLHLEGEDLEKLREKLIDNIQLLKGNDIWFCVNSTPWEYRYEKDNYITIDSLNSDELQTQLQNNKFIKLSRRIDLKEYGDLDKFCIESLDIYLNALH